VKKVRDGMAQAWRRIQQDGIDAYFTAAPEERDKLLDRDIRRIVTAGELWFATNPRSNGQPPKPRKPKPQDSKQEPKKASSDERLFEAYRIAVQSRARKQGIDLPVWMLTPPRR
jgi:hypothetical protein